MAAITPANCQEQLKQGEDFGFSHRNYTLSGHRDAVLWDGAGQIPKDLLSFEQIGLPAVIKNLITRPRGLILVTDPPVRVTDNASLDGGLV